MELTEQLYKKIEKKIEVAKFFAGFITISTSLFSSKLSQWIGDKEPLCYFPTILGIFFVLASLGLCVATMFAYDRLLMPIELWETPPEKDQIDEILFCEMIKVWTTFFRAAIYTFFASLICFFTAILQGAANMSSLSRYILMAALWIVPITVVIWYKSYSSIGKKIHRGCRSAAMSKDAVKK